MSHAFRLLAKDGGHEALTSFMSMSNVWSEGLHMFGNVLGSISGFTSRMNPIVRGAMIAGAAYVAYKLIRRFF